MKRPINCLLLCSVVCMAGCELASTSKKISEEVYEKNAIPIEAKLSGGIWLLTKISFGRNGKRAGWTSQPGNTHFVRRQMGICSFRT